MIRGTDLQGKQVRSESGKGFGPVFEIELKQGRVEALICGTGGFWQRLMSAHTGHRIAWNRVRRVGKEIIIRD
jgi:sporulation protein YlmC with PRC-barrel domain